MTIIKYSEGDINNVITAEEYEKESIKKAKEEEKEEKEKKEKKEDIEKKATTDKPFWVEDKSN